MKKILFIIFLICSNFTSAQIENFTFDKQQVTWSKVFESTKTKEKIKNEIENRNNLKIISVTDSLIVGEFSNLVMNYKKAGFSYMGSPIILNETNKFNGSFKIEFRENRYRATIWNLSSKGMNTTLYSGGIGFGSEMSTSLEILLLKNNREEFRKNFYKVNGVILDTTFIDLMDFTVETTKNDKW
ncbi:hypothetical protein ACRASX_00455 [Flavobacterium sp. TMP13]|uniref:hypothetical protein n=1 Tax=Flavobacterium sp. TMP13 TaxID=3425950 RepID=UPI003D76CC34